MTEHPTVIDTCNGNAYTRTCPYCGGEEIGTNETGADLTYRHAKTGQTFCTPAPRTETDIYLARDGWENIGLTIIDADTGDVLPTMPAFNGEDWWQDRIYAACVVDCFDPPRYLIVGADDLSSAFDAFTCSAPFVRQHALTDADWATGDWGDREDYNADNDRVQWNEVGDAYDAEADIRVWRVNLSDLTPNNYNNDKTNA